MTALDPVCSIGISMKSSYSMASVEEADDRRRFNSSKRSGAPSLDVSGVCCMNQWGNETAVVIAPAGSIPVHCLQTSPPRRSMQ